MKKFRQINMVLKFTNSQSIYGSVTALVIFLMAGIASSAEGNHFIEPAAAESGLSSSETDAANSEDNALLESLNNKAADLITVGELSRARGKINRALDIAKEIGDDEGKAFAYGNLGNYYTTKGQPDSIIIHLQDPFERLTHTSKWINVGNLIATAHRTKGDYSEAIRLYLELLEEAKEQQNYTLEAGIRQNVAGAYQSLGETSTAIDFYLSALELAEERMDSLVLGVLYDNLGVINMEIENFELAEGYLEKALTISEELGNMRYIIASSINYGILLKETERFEESIEMFLNALNSGEKIGNIITPIQARYNLGAVYNEMGEPGKALQYFQESYDLSIEYGVVIGQFYNYTGMGQSYKYLGDLESSKYYFERSLEIAQSMNNLDLTREVSKDLYRVNEMSGDTTSAFLYLQRYAELTDSLSQTEREQALARQEAVLGLRLERENRELAEQALASQQRTLAITIILLVVIIAALLGVLFLYRNIRKVNGELHVKQDELEKVNKEKDKLLSILAHDLRSPLSDLQSVVYLLQEGALDKDHLDTVLSEADFKLQNGISILGDYLQWALNQKQGLKPEIKPCNLYNFTEEIIRREQSSIESKNIKLTNEIPSDLLAYADENMLRVIIRNLVSNAVKFVEDEGQVKISLRVENDTVTVKVSDDGVGIPNEKRNTIFKSFGESSLGTQGETGTGLGLSICKDFIELMDGEISFGASHEGGTEFKFTLPKADVAELSNV